MVHSDPVTRFVVAAFTSALLCTSVSAQEASSPSPGTLVETAELVVPGALPSDFVGWSVAVDEDTIVLGSWASPEAVHVFVRNGLDWDLQAKLVPQGATHPFSFGTNCALDGDTLVLGASAEDLGGGAFYVFERTGSAWDAGVRVTIPGSGGVGASVAIEGDAIVVGAPLDSSSRGAAFVLGRSGPDWVVEHKLTPSSPTGIERFGSELAFQGDTIVVGAPSATDFGPASGRAYLFTFDGATWTQEHVFLPADLTENAHFGSALALDGDLLAIGAPASSFPELGVVHVYSRGTGTWTQEAKLQSITGSPDDRFGSALALSGELLVVGAHIAGGGTGAAYVFERHAGAWPNTFHLVPAGLDPGSRFGLCTAMSGSDIVVGAPYGTPAGSAFVFQAETSPTFNYCLATPNATGLPCTIGSTGSTSIASNTFVLTATDCPPFSPAMFLCGPAQAQLPLASGYLCISPFHPGISRLPPGLMSDAAGFVQRPLDFTQLPPACSVLPGDTVFFQLWYRDANPAGFNLSDGLGATFGP